MGVLWWKKLRRSNVLNVEGIRCWKCFGEIMLPVMDALLIGKNGQKMLGSCHGNNQEYNRREVQCEVCGCKS